ncbi:multidrug and toxin extrusion 2-like [Pelobates cultripes]|uniref:Multidrug and toxin extrusion protein n=1 Tax=Pelobates cultripes TaxID=61616 RepID=A0AAD1VN45_PELCU|nr:multidrug and toxin extrusion 2-like [Pelobates cultripes]
MTEENTESDGDRQPLEESSLLRGKSSWIPRCLHRMLPPGFLDEMKEQCALAGPVFLGQTLVFFVSIVSSMFCGHLGKIELDSVTLAVAVINVIGVSVGTGLSAACDTLISQTYGSKNLKRIGTILQRGIIILMLFCFPCWAIFINIEHILLLFKHNPDIARLTQTYVLIYIPALPAAFLFQLLLRYLQNQGIIWPQVFIGIAVNIINVIINAIFLFILNLGVVGSAWANTISQISMPLLLFIYLWTKKLHIETWAGWSKDCFQEWGIFIRLSIPSMLMMCIKWWSFQIGTFLVGLVSVVELGAQSIIVVLATASAMISRAFAVSASVRIGTALGAGDTEQAKIAWKASLVCVVLFYLVTGIFWTGLKDYVASIFTSHRETGILVSQLMLIFAPFNVFDGIAYTSGGILRGSGKQLIGAVLNAVGYCIIGLPVGISLMFAAKLGVIGLWSGMIMCVFVQSILVMIYIIRINWNKAYEEAQFRAGIRFLNEAESFKDGSTGATGLKIIGDLKASDHKHYGMNATEGIMLQDIAAVDKYIDKHKHAFTEATNVVGEVLSVKQLILRRGLVIITAVATLVIGVLINLLIGNG